MKAGLSTHPLYHFACVCRLRLAGAGGGCSAWRRVCRLRRRSASNWLGWVAATLALLIELTLVIYRDGVRDLSLLAKGFDVWNRTVVTNWSVVGLFLVLFVGGLGVVGWLISVVARAQKPMEGAVL